MSRLLRTAAHAHVASSVIGRNQRRQAQKWGNQAQPAPVVAAAPVAAAPVAAGPSEMETKFAELKMLGELRDSGILTDVEFEAKKALILGS